MTFNEWKTKLLPAGVLLICYFVVPGLVRLFMGAHDPIAGNFTFSLILQAGLGGTIVYKLFGFKRSLYEELLAWLTKFARPPAETRELAEQALLTAGFLSVLAIVWPPVGEMLPAGWLTTLIKVSALGYACYLGYTLWKLAEPFLAHVPAAEPPADQAEPPAHQAEQSAGVSKRRCEKCGQFLLEDSVKVCAFCKHPIG